MFSSDESSRRIIVDEPRISCHIFFTFFLWNRAVRTVRSLEGKRYHISSSNQRISRTSGGQNAVCTCLPRFYGVLGSSSPPGGTAGVHFRPMTCARATAVLGILSIERVRLAPIPRLPVRPLNASQVHDNTFRFRASRRDLHDFSRVRVPRDGAVRWCDHPGR